MNKILLALSPLFLAPMALLADGGVLIPRDKQQPDPAILSLEEMEITVQIDNGDARVFVRQIFANHTAGIQEGNYVFALPSRATVSDFAVWDATTRIPAVILERKRAEEIYNQWKQQSIDPGLLQMGERGAEEAKRSSIFSARIVPIPAYGTKRLEFEYHETITVENLQSYFAIPLRPDAYQAQAARHFRLNFELRSAHALANFKASAKIFPLTIEGNTPHVVRGHFEGQNINLTEDFVATYDLDQRSRRHPASDYSQESRKRPAVANGNRSGSKYERAWIFCCRSAVGNRTRQHRNCGERRRTPQSPPKHWSFCLIPLSRCSGKNSSAAIRRWKHFCGHSSAADKFNLILFNSQTQRFQPA